MNVTLQPGNLSQPLVTLLIGKLIFGVCFFFPLKSLQKNFSVHSKFLITEKFPTKKCLCFPDIFLTLTAILHRAVLWYSSVKYVQSPLTFLQTLSPLSGEEFQWLCFEVWILKRIAGSLKGNQHQCSYLVGCFS